jgi:protein gp37
MSKTRIEWADSVWNPVTGCTPISEACENCYAKRMSKRLAGRCGYSKDEPFKVTLHPDRLGQPLRWKKPRRIFVCSMGDLFHEDVDEKYIAKVLAICDLAREHTYMILTKRPSRMANLFNDEDFQFHVGWFQSQVARELGLPEPKEIGPWPLKNVWLGVTAENQERADERIPILLQIPAAVRFVSVEPMLGVVDLVAALDAAIGIEGKVEIPAVDGIDNWLHWVICGGETGPGARPMHPDWVRNLRYQCQASGVPCFFKSWGEYCAPSQMPEQTYRAWDIQHGTETCWQHDDPTPWRVGKKAAGRLLDGEEWNEVPK